jgi:hypothetical protein
MEDFGRRASEDMRTSVTQGDSSKESHGLALPGKGYHTSILDADTLLDF